MTKVCVRVCVCVYAYRRNLLNLFKFGASFSEAGEKVSENRIIPEITFSYLEYKYIKIMHKKSTFIRIKREDKNARNAKKLLRPIFFSFFFLQILQNFPSAKVRRSCTAGKMALLRGLPLSRIRYCRRTVLSRNSSRWPLKIQIFYSSYRDRSKW